MKIFPHTLVCLLLLPLYLQAASPVIISEIMVSNTRTLADEDGTYSDWIELQNVSTNTVDLDGWFLTDTASNLRRWRFPTTNVPPMGFVLVFASGKDRIIPGRPLHTNFKLDASGEYLALVEPDGQTIASAFYPRYPMQFADVSYGVATEQTNFTLLPSNSAVRAFVPTDAALSNSWTLVDFNDSTWLSGTNAVGFDTGTPNAGEDLASSLIQASSPVLYYRLNEPSGTSVANLGTLGGAGTCANVTLNAAGPRPTNYSGFESNNAAAQFNGSSSYITAQASLLNNLASFTMSGWINPAAAQAARTGLFGQNDAVECGFSAADNLQIWTPGGGSANYTWSLPNNQWYHIMVVGDGSSLRIYVNGALATTGGTATANYGSSSSPFNIGGGGVFDTSGNWFNGVIDEVAVWTRALSPTEIQLQYQAALTPSATALYSNLIGCDVGAAMFGANSSCYARYLFQVEDPSGIDQLTLKLQYDDGFAAYLNGALVAWRNAPGELQWNSAATNYHPDNAAMTGESFNISSFIGTLIPGTNLLAIHGLNTSPTNTDFLIGAELTAMSVGGYASNRMYFTVPTPLDFNGVGVRDLGPVISGVGHTPGPPFVPTSDSPITVTARVEMAFAPMTNIMLHYRVMYGPTNSMRMYDNGLNGDGALGDGIYGAIIPAGVATNGQMLRWYIEAGDRLGRASRWPIAAPNGPEYEGTMFLDPAVSSQLQIWYFFVDTNSPNRTSIDTESGGRLSMSFQGEFYDNIYMELRGNTTAGYPKKSHRLEFNPDRPLKGAIPGWDLRHTSLLSEQADPAYLRTHLSHWLLAQMGVPGPVHYPVHCRLNGNFWGLWFHNDVVGAEQLERLGYDPLGALYKAAGTVETSHFSTGVFEKKTRLWENTQDFDTLAANINTNQALSTRKNFIFDNLNLPEIVNYLATVRWTQEGDDVWANMSLYRDTQNTREWFIIPFDLNVSWGQLYCGDQSGTFNVVVATNDSAKGHPLYGGSQVPVFYRTDRWNRIYDVIIAVPETRQMLLRRMRTLLENYIQPPGTTFEQGIVEQQIRAMTNIMWPEMMLDRTAWGWPCSSGACGMYCWGQAWPDHASYGVPGIINEFVNPRRTHWWSTHCVTNTAKPIGLGTTFNAGIPVGQPSNAVLAIVEFDYNPYSGNQEQEYICLTNPQPCALDISGWRLDGAINFTFAPGTIVPSNSVIYVSPNVYAFRSRLVGPRGGQGLFVVGPYQGQLSARGETVEVKNPAGHLVYARSYPANPSLAQRYLRVTELMYHPLPPMDGTNTEDFEYIELKNISADTPLDLTGVRLSGGVVFDFSGSAVTNLAPGAKVLVVRHWELFASRYGSNLPIAGQYWSYVLNDGGERVRLVDGSGEEVLDFRYDNRWYPMTDGSGFSLVIVDENAEPDDWSKKSQWRASSEYGGSPGASNAAAIAVSPVWITEALTRTDTPPPTDTIELYNPGANEVDISGWYLSDDLRTPAKYSIPAGTRIPPGSFITFDESHFNPNPGTPPSFALGSDGDEVYLFGVDTNTGNLNGYYHGFQFGAAEDGVSFGRYVTSDGAEDFVAQIQRTLLDTNSGPLIGPIVISEIMYRPPDQANNDNSLDEFIELLNISTNTVPLFSPDGPPWKVTGGVDYTFPTNISLAPAEALLLVNFSPANSNQLAAFRALYNVDTNVQIFGPYEGKLNNDSDRVELRKPTQPTLANPFVIPYPLVDKVVYRDQEPWPRASDGLGFSLQRWDCAAYGNEPTNWVCGRPTAGALVPTPAGFPRIVEQPRSQTRLVGENLWLQILLTGDEPLTCQWRYNGMNLLDATNTFLFFTNLTTDYTGDYDVLVQNGHGAALSSRTRVTVRSPIAILQQPQEIIVRVAPDPSARPTNVTFMVDAFSRAAISYQWRSNGINILNATNSSLTIANVATNHWASYSVQVNDDVSTNVSRAAWLYPMVRLQVTQNPVSQRVAVNSPVTLSARISGWPPPFSFEWTRGTVVVTNTEYQGLGFFAFTAAATPMTQTTRLTARNLGQFTTSQSANIITLADTDADGMPNEWETAYGFSTTNASDQLLDFDGDGLSNWQEYQAGTNPTNALSYLKFNALSWAGSQLRLDFTAASNKTYSVQATGDLDSSNWWNVVHIPARATNWNTFTLDANSPTNRFYRLVTPSQP